MPDNDKPTHAAAKVTIPFTIDTSEAEKKIDALIERASKINVSFGGPSPAESRQAPASAPSFPIKIDQNEARMVIIEQQVREISDNLVLVLNALQELASK